MNKKPNFFIVGAPKSGTTALSEYLREHPNVFMSYPKEPHYFASDMTRYRKYKTEDDYFALFKNVKDSHVAIGEASVWYLYSKKAIENIYNFNKNSKIIIMLRKPVDMVYSMHSQHLMSLGEDVSDFEKAWNLEDERKNGNSIPKNILHIPNLYYSEIAKYYSQLENVYKYFPREQVMIILFDEFKNETKKIYDEVLYFLNLPNTEKKVFQVVNENRVLKNKNIAKLLKKEPESSKKIRQGIMKIIGLKNVNFGPFIENLYSIKGKRKPMNNMIKTRIINHYKEEVDNLSKFLKKDLSDWNQLK